MQQLTLSYPDDLAEAAQVPPEDLPDQLRLMAALKLFELGRLSSGKAAELAGLSRAEFIEACGRYGVSQFNYVPDEAEDELRADLTALWEASGRAQSAIPAP